MLNLSRVIVDLNIGKVCAPHFEPKKQRIALGIITGILSSRPNLNKSAVLFLRAQPKYPSDDSARRILTEVDHLSRCQPADNYSLLRPSKTLQ